MTDLISTPCSEWAEQLITQHADDSSSADVAALKKHLLVCKACYTAHTAYQEVSEQIRSLPPMIPQRQLSADMLLNNTNLLSEEPSLSEPESESASGDDHVKILAENAGWYKRPYISVVIPTHNEASNLRYALPYIPATASEVILIDEHSTENTIAEAQRLLPSIKIVKQVGNGVHHQTSGRTTHSPYLTRNVNKVRHIKLSKYHQSSDLTLLISSAVAMIALVATVLLFLLPVLPATGSSSMGISSSTAQTDISLAINLHTQPPPAQLCNVHGADLGEIQQGQSKSGFITFSNCGGQPLSWQGGWDGSSWLKFNKSSGTLVPNGTDQIPFTATTHATDQGLLSATVIITPSVGQPQLAIVTITVVSAPPAQLCQLKDTDLGQMQSGQNVPGTIAISNCGGQPLSWSAQVKSGWVGVTLNNSNGTVNPNSTGQISVTAHVVSEPPGKYTTAISITSNGGNQLVTISVQVVQTALPSAQLCDVKGADLGEIQQGQSKSGFITFSNCGGQPLSWQGGWDGSSWLKLNKSSGTIVPHGIDQIPFTATTHTTDQGSLSATVTIISSVRSQQVTVKLVVSPMCSISVNPIALSFTAEQGGNNPISQSFTVTSNCTGTIKTSVSTNNGGSWLSASSGGYINASGELAINVSVNTHGLSIGSYTGFIKVTLTDANGVSATQQISGNRAITSPPYINQH